MVVRPHPKKVNRFVSEWLPGMVDSANAADEAQALLTDPRDTIVGVYLWDERAAYVCNKWRRKEEPR